MRENGTHNISLIESYLQEIIVLFQEPDFDLESNLDFTQLLEMPFNKARAARNGLVALSQIYGAQQVIQKEVENPLRDLPGFSDYEQEQQNRVDGWFEAAARIFWIGCIEKDRKKKNKALAKTQGTIEDTSRHEETLYMIQLIATDDMVAGDEEVDRANQLLVYREAIMPQIRAGTANFREALKTINKTP